MNNMIKLIELKDTVKINGKKTESLYKNHVNPKLIEIYKLLGLHNIDIEKAKGTYIYLKNGKKVLDFSSALGILSLGHNNDAIIEAQQFCHEHNLIDAFKVGPQKLQAVLGYNLSQLLPKPLSICTFSVSGAEAVDSALKLSEKAQGIKKTKYIVMSGAYHGRTHGTMPITTSGNYKEGFLLSIPQDNIIEIPFGDIETLKNVIKNQTTKKENDIIAIILEPFQGHGIKLPPKNYLKDLIAICKKNKIITIFDEVKSGIFRTGFFCSFQAEKDIVPDIVTISKALGGGKKALSSMITTPQLYAKAYGTKQTAALHSSTFNGLGESCAVAIAALNYYHKNKLGEKALKEGSLFIQKLEILKQQYPDVIKDIRGRGFFIGIEFNFKKEWISSIIKNKKSPILKTWDSIFIASLFRELFEKYNILTVFVDSDPNILHIMPPLIATEKELDYFIESLEKILKKGVISLIKNFILRNLKGLV